jgi:cytochrome c biogenesis protein ResB
MKKIKILIPILLTMLIVSCNESYEVIKKNEVQHAFILNSSPTFKGYHYQGTDKEFHYFASKWELKKDILFKLKKEDLSVNEPFDYETDEIRVDLFKTNKSLVVINSTNYP